MATGIRSPRIPGGRFGGCRILCFCSRSRTGSHFDLAQAISEIHAFFICADL